MGAAAGGTGREQGRLLGATRVFRRRPPDRRFGLVGAAVLDAARRGRRPGRRSPARPPPEPAPRSGAPPPRGTSRHVRPSRRAGLALDAVLDIASAGHPDPVQSRDVTGWSRVPLRRLEQVLQNLPRAGVLRGLRGQCGGHALARERRRITVGDIVRAAGGDPEDARPTPGPSDMTRLVAAPFWTGAEAAIMMRLDAITPDGLCARGRRGAVDPGRRAPDFAI